MTKRIHYLVALCAVFTLAACSTSKKTCASNSDCPADQICTESRQCEKGEVSGDVTSDTTADEQTSDVGEDTSNLTSCSGHSDCKSDEYCDKGGHCRTKVGAGEYCFGVFSGTEMSGACTSGACYREAFDDSLYVCASSTEDCILDKKSVAKGSIVCNSDGIGYVTCEGNGVWSAVVTCSTGGTVCDGFPPDKEKGPTGVTEKQECKNGEGCVPESPECKGCTGYFMVDKATNTCLTNCKDALGQDDDSRCWSIATCIGGACVPTLLRVNGLQCDVNEQCKSSKCVATTDENGELSTTAKVCCSEACDSPCHYCDAEGKCRALSLGSDKQGRVDARCPSTAQSECKTTGRCGADGKCAVWTETTLCRKRACANDKETSPAFCDGKGTCPPATEKPCNGGCDDTGLICKGTVACTTHESCANGEFCAKDGYCHNQREKFESCDDVVYSGLDTNRACASGQCSVDTLSGVSQAICTEVDACVAMGALYDKDAVACKGDSGTYTCKGKDGWELTEECPSGPCDLENGQGKGFIAQQCSPLTGCNHECKACEGNLNANESGCPVACTEDTDCWTTHFCGAQGQCELRAGTGEVCQDETTARKCLDGLFCVESVDEKVKKCCPENCSGICNYCGVTVTSDENGDLTETWSCKQRGSGYVDPTCKLPQDVEPHPDCSTYACTGDDAVKGCVFPTGQSCGDGSVCKDGVLYTFTCREDGSCQADEEKCQSGDCAADGKTCKPLCAAHDDCRDLQPELCAVVGTKTNNCYCDVSGLCRKRIADGKKCEGVSKPKSGLPDDAVCTSASVCKQDDLAYVTTNINNGKGHWYCAKSTECVDEDESGNVTRYADGYKLCAKEAHTDGTLFWICSGGSWIASDKKCPTTTYQGCSYGTLGSNSGYTESICQSGPSSSLSSGCTLSACKTCGGYKKDPDESKKCLNDCTCCSPYVFGCLIIIFPPPTLSIAPSAIIPAPICTYKRDDHDKCVTGYYCVSDNCVVGLSSGRTCSFDRQCKSGVCRTDTNTCL